MHVYDSTYNELLAPLAKVHLIKCMSALKEMETTWASASRQWELLLGIVDLRGVDTDLQERDHDMIRGRKRGAETQDIDSTARSGQATTSAETSAGESSFKRLSAFHAEPEFTPVHTGRSLLPAQSSEPRRTGSISSKQRHISTLPAFLKNGSSQNSLYTNTSSNPASLAHQLPLTNNNFTSPAIQTPDILPSVHKADSTSDTPLTARTPSSSQLHVSPALVNALSPIMFDPPVVSSTSLLFPETAYSTNILGLSMENAFDLPQYPQHAPATATHVFAAHDNILGSTAVEMLSGNAFPVMTDFLLDPFWSSMQVQHGADSNGLIDYGPAMLSFSGDHPRQSEANTPQSAFYGMYGHHFRSLWRWR